LRSLNDKGDRSAGAGPAVKVPYEELVRSTDAGDSWLSFSGSYAGRRHSTLTAIDTANVRDLKLRWVHQFSGGMVYAEASPLVAGGTMFTTLPYGTVVALDAATGTELWRFKQTGDNGGNGIGFPNRGVALLDDKVYVGSPDLHVQALNARTGMPVWDVSIGPAEKHFISSAPLAFKDLVVIGVATRAGGRGFLVALDAATGAERWRFNSIPAPGEPGNDTWGGDSWREGGAPMWMTGAYDPRRDLLFWGVGNPKPDYEPWRRKGDNLYSNSVVALQGTTGKLVWHFQFTPADDKDWDSNQVPVLADGADSSSDRVLWANRNGFFYQLDRATGRYLGSHSFVQQNWTGGIDSTGRPRPSPTRISPLGVTLFPGSTGGTNWWPPTYDPANNLFLVPSLEQGMIYFSTPGSWPQPTGEPFYTAIRALNAATGEMAWERRFPPRTGTPMMGGLVSTAGGVSFAGDGETFCALSTATGEMLWSVDLGGPIVAAPVTYTAGGEQLVTIYAGHDLLTFGLDRREPSVKLSGALPRPR
jgi:alcohol dehydrogenase (cytochrome c)